jgi:hypothetical protein
VERLEEPAVAEGQDEGAGRDELVRHAETPEVPGRRAARVEPGLPEHPDDQDRPGDCVGQERGDEDPADSFPEHHDEQDVQGEPQQELRQGGPDVERRPPPCLHQQHRHGRAGIEDEVASRDPDQRGRSRLEERVLPDQRRHGHEQQRPDQVEGAEQEECRHHDVSALLLAFRLEVEAEHAGGRAGADHDGDDVQHHLEHLQEPVVGRVEVPRVERQQDERSAARTPVP